MFQRAGLCIFAFSFSLAGCSHSSPLDDLALEERAQRLRPLVEEFCGKKLQSAVRILALKPEDVGADFEAKEIATYREAAAATGVSNPVLPTSEEANDSIDGYLAFYSNSRTIFVLQQGFANLSKIYPELGLEKNPAYLDLVLIHEWVHAVQHQELGSRWFPTDREEATILSALHEGHAEFVMGELAKKLGFSEELSRLSATLSFSEEKLPPELKDVLQKSKEILGEQKAQEMFATTLELPYVRSERFFRNAAKKWGAQAAFEIVFQNPPKEINEILHPEKYFTRIELPQK